MGQTAPEELSIPGTSVRPARKAKPGFLETSNDRIGAALLFEQFEDCSNSALYFLIGIKRDLIAVENQANRQREPQLTFSCLIDLSSMEARADDVQLRLSKGAFQAKHKPIVEVGRIVAAIFVDH